MKCKYCGNMILDEEKFCGNCGKPVEEVVTEKETPAVSQKKTSVGLVIVIGVLVAVIVAMVVFGVVVVGKARAAIDDLQLQIEQQSAEIEKMRTKSENYDIICSLNNASIGHISNEFRVTKGTVVLSKDDKGKQITLTTDWVDGATISTEYAGTSATLDFDNSTWYEKTTMTIVPHHEGVTVVTFTNNLNSESFKVLLIVTE